VTWGRCHSLPPGMYVDVLTVDGVGVFYREAGPKDAPTLVLLHGFPSSSREFDTLIPLLATHYHLIAPDFPGFGQGDAPPPSSYTYTFDHLAKTIPDGKSAATAMITETVAMC
jgi:pimeloyl-ACP methyl ester carboxylesterase